MATVPKLDTYRFYEREWASYGQLMEVFEWSVPDQSNVVSSALNRWANRDSDCVAVSLEHGDGSHTG